MAQELSHARERGEFPPSSTSTMDVQFIVEDYELLCQLRELRKDLSDPAPEEYHQFKIEIARRIQERDDALNEDASKDEAARRVDTYLQSVQQERRYFEAASTLLDRRGVKAPTQLDLDKVGEEIFGIVEHVVEQTMADASAPLRTNIGRLDHQAADFRDQNDTYSRQLDLHYRNIEQHSAQCSGTINALNAMFEPQTKNIQATADNLILVSSLANSLSQLVVNLPTAINQVVSKTVQYQTQEAIRDVMDAKQQAMLSVQEYFLHEKSSMDYQRCSKPGIDCHALHVETPSPAASNKRPSRGDERRGKGKLRRFIDRIFN